MPGTSKEGEEKATYPQAAVSALVFTVTSWRDPGSGTNPVTSDPDGRDGHAKSRDEESSIGGKSLAHCESSK